MEVFAQTIIDILAWLLMPFALMLVLSWLTSLFRSNW